MYFFLVNHYFANLAKLFKMLLETLEKCAFLESADKQAAAGCFLSIQLDRLQLLVLFALQVLLELLV